MPAIRTTLSVLTLGLSMTPGYAFWCNHYLISEGMSEAEVRQECGPPAKVEESIEYWVTSDRYGNPLDQPYRFRTPPWPLPYQTIIIRQLTYNRGPHEFMQRLRFEAGVLKRIDSLDDWGY